jgi:hypothetical protein
MPINSITLHAWRKYYEHDQSTDRMPTEPNKYDLLGFPGVVPEQPKWYIRRLWLPAENDRIAFPKFLDPIVQELGKRVNKLVNTLVEDDNKRHNELNSGAFLKKDALHILQGLGFGPLIWGEDSKVELASELEDPCPRWGVHADR